MTLLESLSIVVLGFIPALVALLVMRKAEAEARERLRSAMNAGSTRYTHRFPPPLAVDHQYIEGIGYLIGDLTCRLNARSGYLRCAVNPSGPCKGCPHYQPIEFSDENG